MRLFYMQPLTCHVRIIAQYSSNQHRITHACRFVQKQHLLCRRIKTVIFGDESLFATYYHKINIQLTLVNDVFGPYSLTCRLVYNRNESLVQFEISICTLCIHSKLLIQLNLDVYRNCFSTVRFSKLKCRPQVRLLFI